MPRSTSVWLHTAHPSKRSPLKQNARADVCVIGAGIAGLTTAYLLTRDGRSVVLIDDGEPGCGQTGVTTAHLSFVIDDSYREMIRLHGVEGARLAYQSHRAAIDRIEAICHLENIDADFVRLSGYLFLGPDDDPHVLDEEMDAAEQAGIDVERLNRAPVRGFDTGPCLHFAGQGQFHPAKYLNGLVDAFRGAGGRLYTNTRAVRVTGGSTPHVETAEGFTISSKAVVVATNVPFNDRVAIHTKQAPYHTYVIAARLEPDSVTPALYWDTHDPYHYVRVHRVTSAELREDGDPVDLLISVPDSHRCRH